MNRRILSLLSLSTVFAFAVSFAAPSLAGSEEEVEATVYCVQADAEGNLQTLAEFDECAGTLIAVGADGKTYAIAEKKEEAKAMKGTGEKQTVSGELAGHTRGYILASASALKEKKEASVTGTIICLLPNYQTGSVEPVVALGPCTELKPHAHVVRTKGGQVYALYGSEVR